jgi:hypothetical protein
MRVLLIETTSASAIDRVDAERCSENFNVYILISARRASTS